MNLKSSYSQTLTKQIDSVCFTIQEVKQMAINKQRDKDKIDTLLFINELQLKKIISGSNIINKQDSLIINYQTLLINKDDIIVNQKNIIKSKNRKIFGTSISVSLGLVGLLTYSILK
jgi:hypothetical protein